ncbi:MAG: thiamine pyrophosphate-binding protein [Candidatus Omnitrophota bacterium]|nr:thiamine pyrophosphate-binding protein [Candidatus Omnitrophota bacterium]
MGSVAEYIVDRLSKLGITDCFGVPGDFSFPLNDAVISHPLMRWVGCSNELNASYAADGYARVKGASLLCTTYAVGELSALNGVMGAKAEHVPVFHLVGMPTMRHQLNHKVIHHTFGDGVFQNFAPLSAAAACVSAVLTPDNVVCEMERVIAVATAKSQPAYLLVAEDMALAPVNETPSQAYPVAISDPIELEKVMDRLKTILNSGQRVVIMPSYKIARFRLEKELQSVVEKSGLPFVTMAMDKAVISEEHPQFAGMYIGNHSNPAVVELVQGADWVLNLGGSFFNDCNTLAYDFDLDERKIVTVDIDFTKISGQVYNPVQLKDVLNALASSVVAPAKPYRAPARPKIPLVGEPDAPISVESLYSRYAGFIRSGDIVVAEVGSQNSVSILPFPENTTFYSQAQWASIGFATGCAFGTSIAAPGRRTVLFTGEGSHQMTANELGNMGRYGAKPIIFVLNNSGYMIERALEISPDEKYNDLAPWNYTALPAAFGCKDWFVARAATNAELDKAMEEARNHQGACYIEVIAGRTDFPLGLKVMNSRLMQMYGFDDEREMP